jgi:hypothetical protein
MKHRLLTIGSLSAFVACLAAGSPAAAQGVIRDTVPRAAQKPPVRTASADSLVECSPVAAPAKKKPVARRKAARYATAAAKVKPAPQVAIKPRHPIVHRARRVRPKAATATPVQSTTVVMCRPVRPIAALAKGTPTEQSIVPVPTAQLATNTPPPAVAESEDGPPIYVSTAPGVPIMAAGGGRSWLPFALIPAIFVPFIHTGRTHNGSTPIDTTTTPVTPPDTTKTPTPPDTTPTLPPPTDTTPLPPIGPPTTTPEPGSTVLLATGLLGLAGVVRRKRKK